jgi:hypothetical protein
MTVDLNVLDHLADGLYSSVAAVLTETVANAWDADATEVRICLDVGQDRIEILDDGLGMDGDSINERYLRVGYRRRDEGDLTPLGRNVMGRKGIGKLSLFSIADLIEIHTQPEGGVPAGLKIITHELRQAMEDKRSEYNPAPVPVSENALPNGHGTRITVSSLKQSRLRETNPAALRRRLARRFSVINKDFRVFVDDVEVTTTDREDLRFVEYLWHFGEKVIDTSSCESMKKSSKLSDRSDAWDARWRVGGWIGTVDKPRRLATPEGNLNSVVVLARGRLVDEDALPRIAGAEFYTKYLTGQVQADFLDDSQISDIVTSNRQSVIEDDERVALLNEFLRNAMRTVASEWGGLRTADRTSALRQRYPRVGDWIDSLPQGWRSKAEKLLERLATMEVVEETGEDESKRTLLRHAIYGFERLRLRGDADELERALGEGVEALLRLLADRDALEASSYRDIVSNRLNVVTELQQLVDDDQKERVLQKYLFDHLWLLDPGWERATGNEEMERRLRLSDAFVDNEKTRKKYGRVDIRYCTIAGKHIIIELKRASVRTGIYDLAKQGAKYVDATKELIAPEEKDAAQIEVIFVVGKAPDERSERIADSMKSVSAGSRILTYGLLVEKARQSYSSYLRSSEAADVIEKLFL